MRFTFLSLLIACSSKTIPEAAQCGEMEQDIFLSCLDAQCSASYQQSLAGTDACAVDGSTNTISVEASGSCGFSSSGSCFVICDCPDGAVLAVDVEEMGDGGDTDDESSAECLTVDSPEWTALQNEMDGLRGSVTNLTSQLDTLAMNVGRIDLDVDSLSTTVDEHSTDLESLHAQTDALDAAVGSTPGVISSWEIACVDYLPYTSTTWVTSTTYETTTKDIYACVIGYGFDRADPPQFVYATKRYDVTPHYADIVSITSGYVESCSQELGNDFCFTGQPASAGYTITGAGELLIDTDILDVGYTYQIIIIDDKEYFVP